MSHYVDRIYSSTVLVCGDCECVIISPDRHKDRCLAAAAQHVVETDLNEINRKDCENVETELAVADPHWLQQPLSIALTTRDGMTMLFDGRATSPKPDLSGLDDVDKAALRVLLQQALREIEPNRLATGSPMILHNTQWNG